MRLVMLLLLLSGTGWAQEVSWVRDEVVAPGLSRQLFFSEAAGQEVDYFIYKPPVYARQPDMSFPVLYWLHGGGGGTAMLAPLVRLFGTAMAAQQIPPMLVVFPNGLSGSLWVNSKDGKVPMETIIIEELIPHVDSSFRTISQRQGRIIEGFSMGGYGAARFAFRYPELFAGASVLAGGPLQQYFTISPRISAAGREQTLQTVFGGSHDYFEALSPWRIAEEQISALTAPETAVNIRIVIGATDEMLPVNRRFTDHLHSLGILHSYTEVPDVGHVTMPMITSLGNEFWQFYNQVFSP